MKFRSFGKNGYTLVELMIVGAVVFVIAGIAVPSWMRARENAQKSDLMSELRTTSEAFLNYATDHNNGYNDFPATPSNFSIVPAGMSTYMPQNSTWTSSPAAGGYWYWVNVAGPPPSPVSGYTEFVVLQGCGLPVGALTEVDSLLDDGNLSSGAFQQTGTTIWYAIQ
jgi:type II secretory pathway pseudopilin PulG